jgi:hypothetical protein
MTHSGEFPPIMATDYFFNYFLFQLKKKNPKFSFPIFFQFFPVKTAERNVAIREIITLQI